METPLAASSTTAGSLFAGGRFSVPQFQREYAWTESEVREFFSDLSKSLGDDTYFLGLVIFTGDGKTKDVVDGQQRIFTLTLLASAIYHQAVKFNRKALADRIDSTFLRDIDFESEEVFPRLALSSKTDNEILQKTLAHPAEKLQDIRDEDDSFSKLVLYAYRLLSDLLIGDLDEDSFKRLGLWADFLTNRLYFAVFTHPDPASAYRVFEVVNTRGRGLTTADLLKSYVLKDVTGDEHRRRYDEWQRIARSFSGQNSGAFVNYIRHAITPAKGYVPPRDLYDVLSGRNVTPSEPIDGGELLGTLQENLLGYLQTMDPTLAGPADQNQLAVFSVLNELNVVSVRPILLAMLETPESADGMREILKLVVRRAVVGNLGTGSVEKRFGQAAKQIASERSWQGAIESLDDLNPGIDDFQEILGRRSMNKGLLKVMRLSVLQNTITPELAGYLYYIKPRNAPDWTESDEDRVAYWASTIGNTFIATTARRPMNSSTWAGFKDDLLPRGINGEWRDKISSYESWDVASIEDVGSSLASKAADVWYD
ncbi:DUF262 domain-containing protein [Nocardia sp. NPDC059691]|uniref:DUF262 domain-containing protein n=1 Tax=Nocardia sp. NPDC059691 TaxID=3346908 RepID=UPI0036B4AF48